MVVFWPPAPRYSPRTGNQKGNKEQKVTSLMQIDSDWYREGTLKGWKDGNDQKEGKDQLMGHLATDFFYCKKRLTVKWDRLRQMSLKQISLTVTAERGWNRKNWTLLDIPFQG